jgi:hypothetical protein
MNPEVIIISGGINGITTALTLQLAGIKTTCYAEYIVEDDTPYDPRFASLYPAAAIIPHTINTPYLNSLFSASEAVFNVLTSFNFPFLNKQRHYELFEFAKEVPIYMSSMDSFTSVNDISSSNIPQRPGAPSLHGWRFNCFVTEWPFYIRQLYQLYQKASGTIQRRRLEKEDIARLPSDIIINCCGIWSGDLFGDVVEECVIRGHISFICLSLQFRQFKKAVSVPITILLIRQFILHQKACLLMFIFILLAINGYGEGAVKREY